MDLSGKVAIVTGSSRGIGKATALKLAAEGADIVINNTTDQAALEPVSSEIEALGRECLSVSADISSHEEVDRLVKEAADRFGHIDILVNNAGITRDNLLLRMTDEQWDTVLTVDLKSVFLCTRAVLRHMVRQRWGRIVSITSIVGIAGNPGQANYSSAKAGIIGFTRSIAKEAASRGITVNAVSPGYIESRMTEELSASQREALVQRIPLGATGTPEDVAEAVAFLASEKARYITGQVLSVDGGMGVN